MSFIHKLRRVDLAYSDANGEEGRPVGILVLNVARVSPLAIFKEAGGDTRYIRVFTLETNSCP